MIFFAKKAKSTPRETRYESVLYFWSLVVLFSCPFPLYNLCLKRCFLRGLLPLTWLIFHFCQCDHTKNGLSQVLRPYSKISYVHDECFHIWKFEGFLRDIWLLHSVWKSTKMSHLNFWILAFSPICVLLKVTCLVTLFDQKLQVTVARFALNVEWDVFFDFQALCTFWSPSNSNIKKKNYKRNLEQKAK